MTNITDVLTVGHVIVDRIVDALLLYVDVKSFLLVFGNVISIEDRKWYMNPVRYAIPDRRWVMTMIEDGYKIIAIWQNWTYSDGAPSWCTTRSGEGPRSEDEFDPRLIILVVKDEMVVGYESLSTLSNPVVIGNKDFTDSAAMLDHARTYPDDDAKLTVIEGKIKSTMWTNDKTTWIPIFMYGFGTWPLYDTSYIFMSKSCTRKDCAVEMKDNTSIMLDMAIRREVIVHFPGFASMGSKIVMILDHPLS